MSARTRALVAVVVGLALVTLAGCTTTMGDVPVPGTGVPGDTVQVRARFDEALNLTRGAPVKVNGVSLGKVESIAVDGFVAEVTMTLQDDARLRQGARARLRYTTPLGELFVDVTNPVSGALLPDGAVLDRADTDTAPSVEDALAQASLLVNGGGLDQLQTVTEELNRALSGKEGDYRTLLDRATVFLTRANETTRTIDQVLDSLSSLSRTLSSRERTINRAVREIRPAARVLRRQTPDFTRLLAEVERFTAVANGTVEATRSQLLTLLREVEPVLAELARNNGTFDRSLRAVIRAAASADEVVATDYLNISLQLHLDGVDAGGALEGTLAALLDLVGLDLPLPGRARRAPAPADPAGLNGLVGGLLERKGRG
ncbi:MCE family protein [Nocardioides sp. SYSU DS0651]|uniref:MCE family protein n=1 Tax=Nocardioides sp. SYSU DS0651 TaxID=3415955 RepID=UPI003F4B2336